MAGTPYVRPVKGAPAALADAATTSIWVRGVPAAALSECLKQTNLTAFKQWDAACCKVCARPRLLGPWASCACLTNRLARGLSASAALQLL